jgi:uncharacterized membrane protein YedE/YeeE
MTDFAPIEGLLGGALIGLAAVLLMAGIGRIAGVCGIVLTGIIGGEAAGRSWRLAFILGLPLGAWLIGAAGLKDWSEVAFPASLPITALAGLAVGVGATIGSGCTSGHGICGLSRLSSRSIVATATFMAVAVATVFVIRHLA